MPFTGRWLLALVIDCLQFRPHTLIDVVLEEIIEAILSGASSEDQDLVQECHARVRISILWRLNLDLLPLEEVLSLALKLDLALVK